MTRLRIQFDGIQESFPGRQNLALSGHGRGKGPAPGCGALIVWKCSISRRMVQRCTGASTIVSPLPEPWQQEDYVVC